LFRTLDCVFWKFNPAGIANDVACQLFGQKKNLATSAAASAAINIGTFTCDPEGNLFP